MIKSYTRKAVIAGKFVQIWKYGQRQFYNFEAGKKRRLSELEKLNKPRSNSSMSRAGNNICGLVNCNLELNKFLTLTFKKNVKDLTFANYEFKKFIQKLKYNYKNFKYVCVVEFQGRGAVHYHLVHNLGYVHFSVYSSIWGHGDIDIKRVRVAKSVGEYFVKNFTHYNLGSQFSKHGVKDSYKKINERRNESLKLIGRKKFFSSRGLKRPLILKNDKEVSLYLEEQPLKILYENSFVADSGLKVDFSSCKMI